MTNNLRTELEGLKARAQTKRWREAPTSGVVCAGWCLTCVVENGRLVLAVSLADPKSDEASTSLLLKEVVEVFGEPVATFQATFPMRGATTMFQWKGLL